MKERPIIFNAENVRAILEDRKTQTRRVVKPQPALGQTVKKPYEDGKWWLVEMGQYLPVDLIKEVFCPYGQIGDMLWVRESYYTITKETTVVYYKADYYLEDRFLPPCDRPKYIPAFFLPRRASRITLEITSIRVERLQEITEEDAQKEGITERSYITKEGVCLADMNGYFVCSFINHWNILNAKRGYGWDTNPWVWVISFRRIKQ